MDYQMARLYYGAKLIRASELQEFLDTTLGKDWSVVEARRDISAALERVVSSSKPGSSYFSETVRFPNGLEDAYVTRVNVEASNALEQLSNALSPPRDKVAKDVAMGEKTTAAGSGNGGMQPRRTDNRETMTEQGSQDAQKSYMEARKMLAKVLTTRNALLCRSSFEASVNAVWT